MINAMLLLIAPVFVLAAVLLHSVLTRLSIPVNVVVRFLAAAAVTGVALTAVVVALHLPVDQAVAVVLIYVLMCELYTFLFTFVMTSVSVGLLLTLRSGSKSEGDLEERYNATAMVEARMTRLISNGFLRLRADDDYVVTPRAARLVAIFRFLRSVFRNARDAEPVLGAPGDSADAL
jgi:hypothetical protein